MFSHRGRKLNFRIFGSVFAILIVYSNLYAPVSPVKGDSFQSGRVTGSVQKPVSYPVLQTSTPWLQVYFTGPPISLNDQATNSGVAQHVIDEINKAKKTVDATSDDFNLQPVVKALIDAANRGVTVRVVYDGSSGSCVSKQKDGTVFNAVIAMRPIKNIQLKDGGRLPSPSSDKDIICAKKDAEKKLATDAAEAKNHIPSGTILGIMHDKIVIVDGKVLFMGSWNISANDTYNNNNNLLRCRSHRMT